jgi:hypothetical protein
MKHAAILLGLFAILVGLETATAKPVPKEVAEALRLKFEKGKVYYLEMKTKTVQKMKVMQQDVDQNQFQTIVIEIKPESQTANREWIVGIAVVGMHFKMALAGNNIEFDSNNPMPGSPVAPIYKALLKAKFRATLAPNGEMMTLDGRDELLKGLKDLPPGSESLVKSALSESALKKMFAPIGEFLPDRVERVGAHWNRQGSSDLGPIGKYVYDNKYTYHDCVGRVHEIRATTTMKYQVPEKNDPSLPFTIVDVKVTNGDGKGIYKFDADLGRLTESSHEANFKATMKIRVGGMDTEVDLDQMQTTKVRTLDRNPFAK